MQSREYVLAADGGPEPPYVQHNGRRDYRLWFKWHVVQESLQPGASVSILARKHNMNSNVIFRWRSEYHRGILKKPATGAPPQASSTFIPVGVIGKDGMLVQQSPASKAPPAQPSTASLPVVAKSMPSSGGVEFELPSGLKLRFESGTGQETMRRALMVAKEFK